MQAFESGRPQLKQPIFNLLAKYKYTELKKFEMELRNIFMTKTYDLVDAENLLIIKKWLGREGLYFIQI